MPMPIAPLGVPLGKFKYIYILKYKNNADADGPFGGPFPLGDEIS